MQRYTAAGCGGGVSNHSLGPSARTDTSFPSSNFSSNSRRPSQLTSYKLTCEKEPLNGRLGPPDYYPQTPNCPEETLTREYVQHGYRETVDGLEEAREITLSQLGTFTKPVIVKCKESIRKRLRAINESRAQKRKAGQVYGVPLSGSLLARPCVFPEQKPCGEDYRKKWIESLSQPHKRLRLLAENVPHGYRRKSLFEVLIRHNVPLLRATWFIKVTYLNQVRPLSTSVSSGAPDKTQLARSELWTKDVIEYLQYLLDEFIAKDGSLPAPQGRNHSPQMLLVGSAQHKNDSSPSLYDGDEPSLHFKWWYMVRILQWHQAEGLLIPSHVIEWVLNQIQDKESFETLELLLPVVFGVLETIALSQTYVRNLVEIAVRCIQEPSPGGSSLLDNSRRAYMISALVELLRYLIVVVPDTFVSVDCLPFPPCVLSEAANCKSFFLKDGVGIRNDPRASPNTTVDKGLDVHSKFLSCDSTASSIQKRVDNLAKSVSPGAQGNGVAKAVQALDRALVLGDVREAYASLFENLCDGGVEDVWISDVSPCLRASLKWIGTVSLSLVCSVFFLCEWATCDFRDSRTTLPTGLKISGRKDFSQVYTAIHLLKMQVEAMCGSVQGKDGNPLGTENVEKGPNQRDGFAVGTPVENVAVNRSQSKVFSRSLDLEDIFRSPGPLHDILVCWIDQHEVGKGEGFKRFQLLIVELIYSGIFYPQTYVRQLIVSGIMERNETPVDLERRQRHYRILKQLPSSFLFDALKEAHVASTSVLVEGMHVYSNERRLVLHGLASSSLKSKSASNFVPQAQKDMGKDSASSAVFNKRQNQSPFSPSSVKEVNVKSHVAELKIAISILLHIPHSYDVSSEAQIKYSQGVKRPAGSSSSMIDPLEGTDGCEECKRAKKAKLRDERSGYQQGVASNPLDDDDTWWVKKGPRSVEPFKVDPPLKSTKNVPRGRRKTQSLAQLAAARIEGSQGASTSHTCDNKISCPHHRTGVEGETSKSLDCNKTAHLGDIVTIGKALKRLRLLERRSITLWLLTLVRQLVEGTERTAAKAGQSLGPFPPVNDKSIPQWKLGEDELFAILYLMDVSTDLISATNFLIWLLPKIANGSNSTLHGGRSILMMPKESETHACEVGEAFIISSIRRYENIIIANNLLPEALSAIVRRAAAVMASNGRASNSPALSYGRNLLKRFGNSSSVTKWEKNFKATNDQRLVAEFDPGRNHDGEYGFSPGIPSGVEDLDVFLHQKLSGRLSRAAPSMKEIVQRYIDEAVHYFYGKERKLLTTGAQKTAGIEKWDDEHQIAQKIVLALMDCIRQNGGATQEGDQSLIASAVTAIVSNVGLAVAKMPDFSSNSSYPKFSSPVSWLSCARRIVHIHITCLCLLKEALGERHCRVFEIAFATEASSAVTGALGPGKVPRSQFPETHDSNASLSNEILNNTKLVLARATKAAAAVSGLVVGAMVHGVVSLERVVTIFRLKEGLDIIQFIRSARSNSNGISRSIGVSKVDHSIDIYVHWFQVLIGNCRTVCDGLIVELLGEPYVLALSRMQRMLPLSLVFPPAYSIFAMVIWRPYILNGNISTREDIQVYQSLSIAIDDAIKHQPFRDVCLRDTCAFYDILASDVGDSEFAGILEMHGPDKHLKTTAFVPLRARLFLNAIIDCKVPQAMLAHGDVSWVPGHGESKVHNGENETKLMNNLVHVLDTIQPAKFHWQWVELRLLLNEQVLIEKIDGPYNTSLVEAIRSLAPNPDNVVLSENENNFTDIILTRLLVRPDAAPLYSEVIHLLGRSLEESLLLHAKWFLAGHDVLFGRKSLRQRLINIAQNRGLSTKVQFWRPWGWATSFMDTVANKLDRKFEISSLEEGEVVEEGIDFKRSGRISSLVSESEGSVSSQQYATERALAELILPCMDRSSSDARNTFASELIKQLNNIEQQISVLSGGSGKQPGTIPLGVESAASKGSSRKGIRGGSPGLGRRAMGTAESTPPSSAALRASMWLRLQFLLRLLPIIYSDREPSGRNMRHMLATVLLRLLGSRVVYEELEFSSNPLQSFHRKLDPLVEAAVTCSSCNLFGESLFDQFLSILYVLLSNWRPRWLKAKSVSKSNVKSSRDYSVFDREVAETLQTDLDRMQLPETIRWRLQAAMPVLPRFPSLSVSCQPQTVSTAGLSYFQSNVSAPGSQYGNINQSQRNSSPSGRVPGKSKVSSLQDHEIEIDPWTLLEDGTGSAPTSNNNNVGVAGDQTYLKACHWLKGAVRVRRTDLTYIGAVDEDS